MWFKNLRIFKLTEPITQDALDREVALSKLEFVPCGSLDPMRYGFVPVVGEVFEHTVLGFTIMCAKREEKIMPSASVNEQVEQKAKALSEAENRHIGRKERQTLKDEVIFSMMPKAFTKSSLIHAYIDHQEQLLVVNAASSKAAEDFCSKLREALGSLRCIPLHVKDVPTQVMTHWVQSNSPPAHFELGEMIDLKHGKEGRVIRAKKQDLSADEIIAHINGGMYTDKLELIWRESASFILDDSLAIKRLRFEDSVLEKSNDRNPESKEEQFDADFAVMSVQLRALIQNLIAAFGGENHGN